MSNFGVEDLVEEGRIAVEISAWRAERRLGVRRASRMIQEVIGTALPFILFPVSRNS